MPGADSAADPPSLPLRVLCATAIIQSGSEKDFKIILLWSNKRHFNTKVLRLLEAKSGAGSSRVWTAVRHDGGHPNREECILCLYGRQYGGC